MALPSAPGSIQHVDSGLDDPAGASGHGPLAEFTLDLAKAMLRTGYYAPDHPEAPMQHPGPNARRG